MGVKLHRGFESRPLRCSEVPETAGRLGPALPGEGDRLGELVVERARILPPAERPPRLEWHEGQLIHDTPAKLGG
jgi:hypothetical protein